MGSVCPGLLCNSSSRTSLTDKQSSAATSFQSYSLYRTRLKILGISCYLVDKLTNLYINIYGFGQIKLSKLGESPK